jgi:hypothetical protein
LYELQMSLPLFSEPARMLAGMMIRIVPRDSWTSAHIPIAARMRSPLAVQLPLISTGP